MHIYLLYTWEPEKDYMRMQICAAILLFHTSVTPFKTEEDAIANMDTVRGVCGKSSRQNIENRCSRLAITRKWFYYQ